MSSNLDAPKQMQADMQKSMEEQTEDLANSDVEEKEELDLYVFDSSHLQHHRYYAGKMIATPYDDESLNKFQRRPNSIGEVSWGLVKPDGKKNLFEDQPRMTVAWRFKDADDHVHIEGCDYGRVR